MTFVSVSSVNSVVEFPIPPPEAYMAVAAREYARPPAPETYMPVPLAPLPYPYFHEAVDGEQPPGVFYCSTQYG